MRFSPLLTLLALVCNAEAVITTEKAGKIGLEVRLFSEDHPLASQDGNLSLHVAPEFSWHWDNGRSNFIFAPFLRFDQHDSERTHWDIRELVWLQTGDGWELRTGMGKVFWGVTEFQHLVDIINQDDGVEDLDDEGKLGQPMLNLSIIKPWGTFDAFLLPGFRERTFPGDDGRPRVSLPIDTDHPRYESGAGNKHTDLALRWRYSAGVLDLGLSWFKGTAREPILEISNCADRPCLIPYYEQIEQIGLDGQLTLNSWLWKVEAIHRANRHTDHWATQVGFEYTFYGISQQGLDLGLLLEYGWDQRGADNDTVFQNDLALGLRLTANDAASTELLVGLVYDLDHQNPTFQLEASRRIGNRWKVLLHIRGFSADEPEDPLSGLDKDDHLELKIERYF